MPALSTTVENVEQAMSIKYNTMVYEMRAAGRDVLVMSLGEAFFDIPLFSIADLPFPDLYHYSHSRGLLALREKLAEHHSREHALRFDPASEIVLTAGSKAAIYMALLATIDPGDEVLYHEPAWVSYPQQIKLAHGVPVAIPNDGSEPDYERYITDRTRAIIITNPHNPRGYVYSKRELETLLELAATHDVWLLSDEAYSDFVIDGSFESLAKLDAHKRHSIVFNSMSKNHGMSGWRVGYAIANAEVTFNLLKVNQHLITCPPTPLQYYLYQHFDRILAITKPQIVDLLLRRDALARHMDSIGLAYMPGTATFYFFVSIAPSRLGSEDFCTALLTNEAVCVVPGAGYGASCDKFVRVSIGTATMEENKRGLDCIKRLIDSTR